LVIDYVDATGWTVFHTATLFVPEEKRGGISIDVGTHILVREGVQHLVRS
jgi:hypothetical protein